ncbi:MAG: diguanylate cyclase [Thiothrix sp.]
MPRRGNSMQQHNEMISMNKKKASSSLHTSPLILLGQITFLSRHGSIWFWGNILAASLFVLLRWVEGNESMALLLAWFGAMVGINVVRWLFGQRFLPSQHYSPEELQEFGQRYLIYSTLISTLWGVSGFILFSQEPLVQAVHVTLLAGAVIAAMPVLALSTLALYMQIGVILLPITLDLLLLGHGTQHSLALATALLGILLAMASRAITSLLNDLHAVQIQMQEQAHTDPVTQIANRRFFDTIFKTEWRRAAREGKTISLLMIDVDHFKRYNDRHGHHAGDQCLQIIAQCIKAVARRASDVVARHGGEEFVILLPDTSLENAFTLAERVRKNVEEQRIPHSDGGIPRIVTVSIGVSSCTPNTPRDATALEEAAVVYPAMLLNAADRALYRSKRNGRNQVARESCGDGIIQLSAPPSAATTHAA